MEKRYETYASFECPKCGIPMGMSVEVPEPKVDAEPQEYSEGETEVECSECKALFNAHVESDAGGCRIRLSDHPDTKVEAGLAHYVPVEKLDWSHFDIPADPYLVFMNTYHGTRVLLQNNMPQDGTDLLNRMIFTQQIGALEAYLSDTLINQVSEKQEALARLLAVDTELLKEKYTLSEIAFDPEFVKDKVREYLQSIMYHNLPKVNLFYKAVFKIDLFKLLDKDKDTLFRAIEHRHDCAHRNGRNKEGQQLDIFNKPYVSEMSDILQRLAHKIETEIFGDPENPDEWGRKHFADEGF